MCTHLENENGICCKELTATYSSSGAALLKDHRFIELAVIKVNNGVRVWRRLHIAGIIWGWGPKKTRLGIENAGRNNMKNGCRNLKGVENGGRNGMKNGVGMESRMGLGSVYLKSGFKKEGRTGTSTLFTRTGGQKNGDKIKSNGGNFCTSRTKTEIIFIPELFVGRSNTETKKKELQW